MWNVALLVFLSCTPYFASGGRLPRDDNNGLEEGCHTDSDCHNGFVCSVLKCICPEDYVISDNRCVRSEEEYQSKCKNDEQCKVPYSVCSDGKCMQENVSRNGLGDTCNDTSECESSLGLTCENGTCQCVSQHVRVSDSCLKKASKIGEECVENVQCEHLKGFCSNGTCQISADSKPKICDDKNSDIIADQCQCKEGFVKSEDMLLCLEKAETLGESCVSSKQCEHLNGTCSDNICVALTKAMMTASAVEGSKQAIASPCNHDDDCKSVNDAVCKEAICQCRLEYISSDDQSKCLLLARKAGDQCEIDKQCSKIYDSSCLEGKCVAVAAAGIKTRSNGSPQALGTSAHLVLSTFLIVASKIFF